MVTVPQFLFITLETHYQELTETTTSELVEIEQNLQSSSNADKEKIELANTRAEREEDKLRTSLERTRKSKCVYRYYTDSNQHNLLRDHTHI